MSLSGLGNIHEIVQSFQNNFGWTALTLGLMGFIPQLLKWFLSEIKLEHFLQITLNNRIRFIKKELKENLMSDSDKPLLLQYYHQLLDQKIYGIKNIRMQKELKKIISNSSEITDVKYFKQHQYILNLDENNNVFIDKRKLIERWIEVSLLVSLAVIFMALGVYITKNLSPYGIFIFAFGIVFYFFTIRSFPANFRSKEILQAHLTDYYSQH